jgi:hypothetical protein
MAKQDDCCPWRVAPTVNELIDLLRKSQVGQAFSLTPFGNMHFGGLKARPTNTYARGLVIILTDILHFVGEEVCLCRQEQVFALPGGVDGGAL